MYTQNICFAPDGGAFSTPQIEDKHRMGDMGLLSRHGPADALSELSDVLAFVGHALMSACEAKMPVEDNTPAEQGLISLIHYCSKESDRIARHVPVSVSEDDSRVIRLNAKSGE